MTKIELKNVKVNRCMSEETYCFSASVWVDGIRAGEVSNRGNGGPHMYSPSGLEKQIDEYAKTLPDIDISYMYRDGKKHTLPNCAELVIGELVTLSLKK